MVDVPMGVNLRRLTFYQTNIPFIIQCRATIKRLSVLRLTILIVRFVASFLVEFVSSIQFMSRPLVTLSMFFMKLSKLISFPNTIYPPSPADCFEREKSGRYESYIQFEITLSNKTTFKSGPRL